MDDKLTANAVDRAPTDGFTALEAGTPLTRLHYFDGKFLRADALTLDQEYYRTLVRLSNLAGGWGAVHGFGIREDQGSLVVGGGLATTPRGSVVLLNGDARVPIETLVGLAAADMREAMSTSAAAPAAVADGAATSRNGDFTVCGDRTPPGPVEIPDTNLYLVTVGPTQRLCGNEEVYGKLCEDACVTDTQRPYWREGVVIRLRPITLALPASTTVQLGNAHLRSRAASAYFASEALATPALICRAGLQSEIWCQPARVSMQDEVAIGMVARAGTATAFLDAWSARRERMDTQARGYWQARMMMRPWNVFVAQILQFQCQLTGMFRPDGIALVPRDDCGRLRDVLTMSVKQLNLLRTRYEQTAQKLYTMVQVEHQAAASTALDQSAHEIRQVTNVLDDVQLTATPYVANRLLLNGGFVELPSAGYLPLMPGDMPVDEQMRRMFGEGVNLHFCTARADYIAHALEEAQHMQRISLTRGLDDPARREEVEIFVPDGELVSQQGPTPGANWLVQMDASVVDMFGASLGIKLDAKSAEAAGDNAEKPPADDALTMIGVARTSTLEGGGAALTLVCQPAVEMANKMMVARNAPRVVALYIDLRVDRDPFAAGRGEVMKVAMELRNVEPVAQDDGGGQPMMAFEGNVCSGTGTLTVEEPGSNAAYVHAQVTLAREVVSDPVTPPIPDLVVDVGLRLMRAGNTSAGNASIVPVFAAARMRARWLAEWDQTPRVALFSVVTSDARQPLPMSMMPRRSGMLAAAPAFNEVAERQRGFVRMTEIPPLAVDDDVRLAALDTLNAIALATKDDTFLKRAGDRLFPDTSSTASGFRIRAARDWVLFRRQRKAVCDASIAPAARPQPQPQPQPPQSFKVWYMDVGTDDVVRQLLDRLHASDPAQLPSRPRMIDVLQFPPNTPVPDRTAPQILADFAAAVPSAYLALAVVWPRASSAAENDLSRARLQTVVDAVAPSFPQKAGFSLELPVAPPVGLEDPASVGGMLLVGFQPERVRTSIHHVFFMKSDKELQGRMKASLMAGDQRGFLAAMRGAHDVLIEFAAPDHPDPARWQEARGEHQNLLTNRQRIAESWSLVSRNAPDANTAREICDYVVAKLPAENALPLQTVALPDFGAKSMTATILFFESAADRDVPPIRSVAKAPRKRPPKRPG